MAKKIKTKKKGAHRPVLYKTKTGWKRPKKSKLFPKPITLQGGNSMAGLPKMFAKMGFKKGWAAYKRSHGGSYAGSRKGKYRSRSRRRPLWLSGDMSAPAIIQRPVKTFSSITPKKIFSPVVDLVLLVAGMAAGAMVKKAVPIKNPHLMNAAQTIGGVGGSLMTRNRFIKMPLLGVALQSTISEAKILMPKLPLAGDDEVVYLEDMSGDPYAQIEYAGEDDRMAEEVEIIEGDDREEVYGEGGEGGE